MRTITTTQDLAAFCATAKTQPYVTIDTEFLRERTFWSKLCLIQMALPGKDGEAVLASAKELSLEGIISKKLDSPYRSGRSENWTRAKVRAGHEVVLGGWKTTQGKFRSLMAGVYRGKGALKELFLKVMGMMDVAALDRGQTTVGGDCAVTLVSFRFADPSLAPAELCELFRFRDGKVCEIRPYYFDPATVVAAVEAKKAAVSA